MFIDDSQGTLNVDFHAYGGWKAKVSDVAKEFFKQLQKRNFKDLSVKVFNYLSDYDIEEGRTFHFVYFDNETLKPVSFNSSYSDLTLQQIIEETKFFDFEKGTVGLFYVVDRDHHLYIGTMSQLSMESKEYSRAKEYEIFEAIKTLCG